MKPARQRKFILALFFLFLILAFFLVKRLASWQWDLRLEWPPSQGIASPLPLQNPENFLLEKLNEYNLKPESLKKEGEEIVASIAGILVFFNLKEDLTTQVVSLQLILSRAKIEGRAPRLIDLRFSKPVVSY